MAKRIGEWLTDRGALQPAQLDRALRLQQDSGERLGTLLVKLNMIAERDLAQALADQLGLQVVPAEHYPRSAVTDVPITPQFLRRAMAVPVAEEGDEVIVAMADPLDQYTVEALQLALERPVQVRVGLVSEIENAIQHLYGEASANHADGLLDGPGEGAPDADDVQYLRELASEEPVIRQVNALLSRALEARASDVHIEPFESLLKVRYRVDGALREVDSPPASSAAAVISRIKVMANLNIAERRLPQDGRIKLPIDGREVDLRVSTVPTLHGESVVLRILDRSSVALDFDTLGYHGGSLETLQRLLRRPHGIVLVTGPTGSGKTTTLYTALETLNTADRKVLTVEDPVEYELEGINQIHVHPQIGLTFAGALRSILRQDPDVIMVGEMRDLETATIAVQAALTGHKVFSTLHTNDAASSITRLLDMGVDDYLVTSTVNGVVAQRLVRRLCEVCREPYAVSAELARRLGLPARPMSAPAVTAGAVAGAAAASGGGEAIAPVTPSSGWQLYRAIGCPACDQTGYQGRICIVELVEMTDALRRLVLERADAGAIRRAAEAEGAASMFRDGVLKATRGLTSIEEVERVTSEG